MLPSCPTGEVQAASDTDVTIIKAESVAIEDAESTIIGRARTTFRLISDAESGGLERASWMGRPVTLVKIDADRAAYIDKRPELNFNDPDGSHAEEKGKTRDMMDAAWAGTFGRS